MHIFSAVSPNGDQEPKPKTKPEPKVPPPPPKATGCGIYKPTFNWIVFF